MWCQYSRHHTRLIWFPDTFPWCHYGHWEPYKINMVSQYHSVLSRWSLATIQNWFQNWYGSRYHSALSIWSLGTDMVSQNHSTSSIWSLETIQHQYGLSRPFCSVDRVTGNYQNLYGFQIPYGRYGHQKPYRINMVSRYHSTYSIRSGYGSSIASGQIKISQWLWAQFRNSLLHW